MGTTSPRKVTLASVLLNQIYQNQSSGQLFVVLGVNMSAKSITVRALTSPSGAGSAKAPAKGEERTLVNGHQWCSNVLHYLPSVGEVYK